MTRIFCLRQRPNPGDLVWIEDYDGNCDNCGAHHQWPDIVPAMFVSQYSDKRGMTYDMFEICVYKPCLCGGMTGTITLYTGGMPANAFGLFAEVEV